MVASPSAQYISPKEYLEEEKISPIKHEYHDGEVYAMAGASDAHVTITLNLASLLRNHLRGSGCRSYVSDMKAQIEAKNRYYYPDVMVTCDERDRQFDYFKRYPCLIVEVLSETTEAFDRGDKFADYRNLESLQEYVVVSQARQRVEVFRRNEAGLWVLHPFEAGAEVELATVGFRCAIADLYEDVELRSEIPDEAETEIPRDQA
ncbi:MAG TPA: Uma2 family endonuclease [Leptolyngbyaceae cyanobacterium]